VSERRTNLRADAVLRRHLEFNPHEDDLDTLKVYPHTENEAASLRHSKLRAEIEENMPQGQQSRSKCLLAFFTGHIPTKLHQDFLRIGSQIHRRRQNNARR